MWVLQSGRVPLIGRMQYYFLSNLFNKSYRISYPSVLKHSIIIIWHHATMHSCFLMNPDQHHHWCASLFFFLINKLRPRQNGRHFPDDLSKCIFLTENVWILIRISLKFVSKGPINNNPALVQIMAWRRPGDKPLSGPRMENLLTHICFTRPQWVNIHIHLAPGNPTLWCGILIVYN